MGDINNVKVEPHLHINVGRSNPSENPIERTKRIGILNRGKGNKFFNNRFIGLDTGIQDEGEDTEARGNRFE